MYCVSFVWTGFVAIAIRVTVVPPTQNTLKPMKSTTILTTAILATANAASHSISWKGLAKGSRGSSCAVAQKVIEADWYDVTFLSASSDQSCSKAGKRDKTYKTVYNCKA